MVVQKTEAMAVAFMNALQSDSHTQVRALLAEGMDPNLDLPPAAVARGSVVLGHMSSWHHTTSLSRYPAFLEAVLRGDSRIVATLLEAGANACEAVDDGGHSRWSAIDLACNAGNIKVVRALCKHGGHAISLDRAGLISTAQIEIVECLSAYPQHEQIRDELLKSIMRADVQTISRVVPLLIAAGAHVDGKESAESPLCKSIVKNDSSKLEFLLSLGATVTKDSQSHAMKKACDFGAAECIRLLTAAGATVHELDIGAAFASKSDDAIVAVLENCRETGRSHMNMRLPKQASFTKVVEAVVKAGYVKAARYLFEVLNEDPYQKTSRGASILQISGREIKEIIKARRTADAIANVVGDPEVSDNPRASAPKGMDSAL